MPTPLRTILCLWLSTLFMVGNAQQYFLYDQKPFLVDREVVPILKSLDTLIRELDKDPNLDPLQLFKIDQSIYAVADGHSYFWKWERDSFRNLYQGYFHGFNFGGYKFLYNGEVHSYGGYGYWQFMPFLTYFDWETRGWEIRPFANEFPKLRGATQRWAFRDDSVLYVAFTEEMPYLADREIIPIESDNFHRLDLETNSWEQLGTINTSLIKKGMARKIETENYYGFFNNSGNCSILKKDSLLLKAGIPLAFTPLSRSSIEEYDTYSLHIKGDSIGVFTEDLYYLGTVDLDEVYRSSGLPTELIYDPIFNSYPKTWFWVLVPALLLIGYGWYRYRSVNKVLHTAPDFPYPALLDHTGRTIDTQTLDDCLSIHPKQSESSKRNRRSQILQEIEQHYGDIIRIERLRSKEDKRVFEYFIRSDGNA